MIDHNNFFNADEAPEKYWDFESLKNPPTYTIDHHPSSDFPGLTSILIDGVMENGEPTKVFAYIAIPDGEMPAGGWPGIVLVHGGGGTAFAWAAELWRSYGYAVILPDWYGRRPVNDDQVREPGPLDRPYVAAKRPHTYDTRTTQISNVANLVLTHSLFRTLPQVNPDKIAYAGLSWGSWYGAMVTAVDPRFKGIIEIYLGDRRAHDLLINGRFLHTAKSPMYYVVGTNDAFGFPGTMQDGFTACGKMLGNRSMIVELPHSHQGFRFKVCRRYADAILKDQPGLPLLGKTEISQNTISCPVLDQGKGIKKCFLCITKDHMDIDPPKRKWEMLPADFDGKTISARLPEGVFQCFLSAYDEEELTDYCCGTGDVITF